jgi:5'-nucleotidase
MRLSPTLPRLQSATVLRQSPANLARQGRVDGETIDIAAITDFYQISPAARFSTVLEQLLKEHPQLLLLFGGDGLSPSPESSKTLGAHMVDIMNVFNRQVKGRMLAVIGNHEFDFGFRNLIKQINRSHFKWLGANLLKNERHLKETPAYQIIKINGRRILVYGVVVPEVYSELPKEIRLEEPLKQIKLELLNLIKTRRPDMVVILGHLGEDYYKDLLDLPYVDLEIIGHQHTASAIKNKLFCADANIQSYIQAQVTFKERPLLFKRLWQQMYDTVHDETPKSNVEKIEAHILPLSEDTPEHPAVLKAVDPELLAWSKSLDEPVAQLEKTFNLTFKHLRKGGETREGNWLADTLLQAWNYIHPNWPAEASMIHAGSLRLDNTVPKGPLTKRDLADLLPFHGNIVRIQATGALVKAILEEALAHGSSDDIANRHPGFFMNVGGLEIEADMSKRFGERIKAIYRTEGHQLLTAEDKIYLTLSQFLTERKCGLSALPDYVEQYPERVKMGKTMDEQVGKAMDEQVGNTMYLYYIQSYLESLKTDSTLPKLVPTLDDRWKITN